MSESVSENVGLIIIVVGVIFDLLGCIGLVRLPDIYNRLQAATKCVTLGTCMILVGVAINIGLADGGGAKALICAAFVLLTSPVGAHALARAAHKAGIRLWEGSVVDKYLEVDSGKKVTGAKV